MHLIYFRNDQVIHRRPHHGKAFSHLPQKLVGNRLLPNRHRLLQRGLGRRLSGLRGLGRNLARGLQLRSQNLQRFVSEQRAQQTLTFIRQTLLDAFWTGIVVAAVKLIPLLFVSMQSFFQSVLPVAGIAAVRQQSLFTNNHPFFDANKLSGFTGLDTVDDGADADFDDGDNDFGIDDEQLPETHFDDVTDDRAIRRDFHARSY